MSDPATRFAELFKGLDRARGVFHPRNAMMETVRETPTTDHFNDHLGGCTGIGIVPINDEATCNWCVIDVDAHEPDWYVDIPNLAMEVEKHALPLVVCQSKSQGAHCYLFLAEPVAASKLQNILREWAQLLKEATKIRSKTTGEVIGPALIEIFPKQKKLASDQVGNWVNLPYFKAKTTDRYAYASNRRLTLDEFLDLAESKRVKLSDLTSVKGDHSDAPPCIQHMLTHGVDMGARNNSLFNIGTYLRKAGCDNLEEVLFEINYDKNVMPKALAKNEVSTIARSAAKGNYNYRCNETPLCDLCDRDLCRTRKYGVGEAGPTKAYDAAMFGSLTKILTDPPRWIMEVNGIQVELTTDQLMEHKQVRKALLEKVGIVAPPMKNEDWAVILRMKNEQRIEVSAPDDASPGAIIGALLAEFTGPVEKTDGSGQPLYGKREDLLRGRPAVLKDSDTGETFVYFRGPDFITLLKRKRAEEFKGAALWSILRNLGCTHDKLRIGSTTVQVWAKPFQPWDVKFEAPKPVERF